MNHSPKTRWLWMGAAGGVLSWYATSGPHLYDSGELVVASWTLGASHPPGQPLHALAGHVFCLFPLGPITWRVALLSVACVLFAGREAAETVREILSTRGDRTWASRVASEAVGVGTVLSPIVLRQSNRVEVYGLALALFAIALRRFIRFTFPPNAPPVGTTRDLGVALLSISLAFIVHPPHGMAAALAGAVLLLSTRRGLWRTPRRAIWPSIAGTLPLLAFAAYYPLRALAGVPMWGEPTTWSGFLSYISAEAYRENLVSDPSASFLTAAASAGRVWLDGSGPAAAIGALLFAFGGPTRSDKNGRFALLAAVTACAAAGLVTPVHSDNPDTVAYLGPAVLGTLVLGGLGLSGLATGRRAAATVGAFGFATLALHPLATARMPERIRTSAPELHTLAVALTETPAPRALVVIESDFHAATWMSAQTVEGARPDVAALIRGLSTSSWHWRALTRHPQLRDGPIAIAVPGDGYTRFTQGAIGRARGKVEVLSETGAPVSNQGLVAGPYLAIPPAEPPTRALERTGDRLAPTLGRAVRHARGDRRQVQSLLRMTALRRAERMYLRGRTAEARQFLADSLPNETSSAADSLNSPRAAIPPVAYERSALGRSGEDAVRVLAAWQWASGEGEMARNLLALQLGRGDPTALLQLAWLEVAEGRPEAAQQAVEAYRTLASLPHTPELDRLGRALSSELPNGQ